MSKPVTRPPQDATPLPFDFNKWQRTQPWDDELPTNRDSSVRDLLAKHRTMPRLECADGFSMSVQASEFHYCAPRESREHTYSAVEVGYPNRRERALMEYAENRRAPTQTVYGWVPVEVVNAIVTRHGGLKRG